MTAPIEGWARQFLSEPRRFGTLSTILSDGAPHQAVVWYTLTDEGILVNSAVGRIWPTNLLREPRCSLAVEAGYAWLGVAALAEPITDQTSAQADIAAMTRAYHADDQAKVARLIRGFEGQQRISFLLRPTAGYEHPDT